MFIRRIVINSDNKLTRKQKKELRQDIREMAKDLHLKRIPEIHIYGDNLKEPKDYHAGLDFPICNRMEIPNSGVLTFSVAEGLYMAHINETGEINHIPLKDQLPMGFGYAIAYCRRKSYREGKGLYEYIPYNFRDSGLYDPQLDDYIFKIVNKAGLPQILVDNADYLVKKYHMN